ncbi:hypothetical protein [Streptomyces sp. bgisy153]|uniref:hypothetical protein n=1 Tax=Streptomyces sp. bgisy153 TaxID=3413793 RepID=UPI003D709D62
MVSVVTVASEVAAKAVLLSSGAPPDVTVGVGSASAYTVAVSLPDSTSLSTGR